MGREVFRRYESDQLVCRLFLTGCIEECDGRRTEATEVLQQFFVIGVIICNVSL